MSRPQALPRSRPSPLVLAVGVLLPMLISSAAPAAPNNPQLAKAQALFNAATKLMAEDRYAEACPKLEEALHLQPAKIGLTLAFAECLEHLGKLAKALARYQEAASMAQVTHDPRLKEAGDKAAALEKRLPRLKLIPPVQEREVRDLEVHLDGDFIEAARWGREIPVDPGKHEITAAARGKNPWRGSATLPAEGGTVSINLPALEDIPPIPAPVSSAPSGGVRMAAVISLGLGGASIVGGVVCFAYGAVAYKDGPTAQRDFFFGIGGALATAGVIAGVVGAVVLAGAPRSGKASLPGRFIAIPVISPSGGGVVMRRDF